MSEETVKIHRRQLILSYVGIFVYISIVGTFAGMPTHSIYNIVPIVVASALVPVNLHMIIKTHLRLRDTEE